jgi:serine protease Do
VEISTATLPNYGRYGAFAPWATPDVNYEGLVATGTAFAVSREGVFLTNAHEIGAPGKEILDKPETAAVLLGMNKGFLSYLTDAFGAVPENLRPSVMISLAGLVAQFCEIKGTITGIGVNAWGAPPSTHIERASVIHAGTPGSISDLALLKVPGLAEHVIVLPLGDSNRYRNPIHALGFPGVAQELGIKDDPSNVIKHDGEIHSVTVSNNGRDETWFHMTAAITHGDSGGPVVDASGRVVGINCKGLEEISGQNLAIPINVAKRFLDNAGVHPSLGPLTQHWLAGWDAFAQGRYSAARQEFLEVAADELGKRRSYAREAIADCERADRQ